MKIVVDFLKRYPLSTTLIVVIWVLCLIPSLPETPLDYFSLIDKWTHLAMYGTLVVVIWWEYTRQHPTLKSRRLFLWAFLAPVAMGGLVELAQAYCTGGRRSGEWFDFVANSVGVVLGTLIGILLAAFRAKARKDT
ncbi:MAG: VanZ family protein [Prevotella sp.]|nr:VanZ family protein [Prevotella sp.]